MSDILRKIFGTKNDREIKKYRVIVEKINALESKYKSYSDEDIGKQTVLFRERLAKGETLNDILPEAFAVVREAATRVHGMRHFDVQMIGGIVLHEGRIAEMKTGEGKTLTATCPVYLNALAGKGVHVVTVNDYLATRDSQNMGELYRFLGLTTGLIVHGLNDEERQQAYGCDVTYGTNNEFGFDYLRDNMKTEWNRMTQRGHSFCIVDEVDSILIDEARTPLIISGPAETSTELYYKVNDAIPGLQKDSDYIVDEKGRSVSLTEDGISKLEKRLRVDNLYDPHNIDYLHHVQVALRSHVLFKKDVDYVVRDNKVVIVDEFTGRLMAGRRYSDGLHGALEAKEHLKVENETQVLATITFQNFFRLYEKLSGMTGTADTEAVEFKKIYSLEVVVIPTNRDLVRADEDDEVYLKGPVKFNVIADEIAAAQKRGQPVLVGTVSVEKSELLSNLLKKRGTPHEILNAKNHAREAQIIAMAGHKGQVTISTNMAGRGTDIQLGEGVRELGGLYVIGTERHESRRIDNQLRGRSGRQGDHGRSKFYLSLEDDLMRIFASDRLTAIMSRLGMTDDEVIKSPMVSRAIEKAQKRVEEQNFSSRKHVLEYDDIMNQQRKVVYGKRRIVLQNNSGIDFIDDVTETLVRNIITKHSPENGTTAAWDFEAMLQELRAELVLDQTFTLRTEGRTDLNVSSLTEEATKEILKRLYEKLGRVPPEVVKQIESYIYLQIIDQTWKEHLRSMETLQDNVRLRGYGQRDPLQEYKKEAFELFESLMVRIEDETVLALHRMPAPELVAEQAMEVDEPDEGTLAFNHPDAPSALQAGASAQSGNGRAAASDGRDDGMIYYGSRRDMGDKPATPKAAPAQRQMAKVGRNDPCPCGSGQKYKKCHGKNEVSAEV